MPQATAQRRDETPVAMLMKRQNARKQSHVADGFSYADDTPGIGVPSRSLTRSEPLLAVHRIAAAERFSARRGFPGWKGIPE
jgi:hypothetical protein